ncbi:hypothetical protein FOXYSP1_20702 [Fusarium oxysporum f. sp. phaseoli]
MLNQRWLICEGSQDKNRKKHSRHGGPPPLPSSTRDLISRRLQAAHQS